MGRPRGGKKAQSDRQKKPREVPNGKDGEGYSMYRNTDFKSEAFEEYYRAQNIIPDKEWEPFLSTLKTELPLTFRVTGSRAHAETINNLIKTAYVPTMQNVIVDGTSYDPPQSLPWYPDGLGWQVSAPKRIIRKSTEYKIFQRFLVGETEVGNLSRQEAVSMIPPLLMDVEPHHQCLDMCAAPGSKTAQIMEALNPHHTTSTGLLIANDSDYKRTHMLVHQTGRMPSVGLMVTNLDASMYPNISLGNNKSLSFDRILADVPCSGDGTLRKNSDIWQKWGAADGNSLHSLQLRILERAMSMLKPGGRLVYSTCSFNPIENEAVVAAALRYHPGDFKLVDVSDRLPNLKRREGMTTWKVATQPESADRKMRFYESFKDYREAVDNNEEREKDKSKGLASTCWPDEKNSELGLEKCLRLLPHDQDTGGFFVCVLEKAGPRSSSSSATPNPPKPDPTPVVIDEVVIADEAGSSTLKRAASPSTPEAGVEKKKSRTMENKKQQRDLGFKEDPYSFVDGSDEEIQKIVDWFQLKDTFSRDNLLVRNDHGKPQRTIYLANDIVKRIIQNNDFSRLRIISAGVKGFVRQDSSNKTEVECKWRIPSEGIFEILPHVPDTVIVKAGLKELRTLLEEQYPPVENFEPETRTLLSEARFGNMIIKFEGEDCAGGHLAMPLYLPVWKAKTSMSLLIDKREKSMLSLRTYGEDICKLTVFQQGHPEADVQAKVAEREAAEKKTGGETVKVDVEGAVDDEEAAMNA
ncbi:hypothetical protein P7C73_g3530, partial [Tremellales sp. Uapishka_1]